MQIHTGKSVKTILTVTVMRMEVLTLEYHILLKSLKSPLNTGK